MRFRHVVMSLCAIVFMACAGVVPAAAAAPPDPVGVMGGQDVRVTINRAALFQCPASFCNYGEARPGDDLQLW